MFRENRTVAVAVAALLVWSAAFGGGYTVALFTANADVSGTFETAESFPATADPSTESTVDGQEPASSENGSAGLVDNDTAEPKTVDNRTTEPDPPAPADGASKTETDEAESDDDVPAETDADTTDNTAIPA